MTNASLIIIYVCVCVYWAFLLCVICRLSVIFSCSVVVVFYLSTCNLFINVWISRPNILTIITLTFFVNQSICAETFFHLMLCFMDDKVFEMNSIESITEGTNFRIMFIMVYVCKRRMFCIVFNFCPIWVSEKPWGDDPVRLMGYKPSVNKSTTYVIARALRLFFNFVI